MTASASGCRNTTGRGQVYGSVTVAGDDRVYYDVYDDALRHTAPEFDRHREMVITAADDAEVCGYTLSIRALHGFVERSTRL